MDDNQKSLNALTRPLTDDEAMVYIQTRVIHPMADHMSVELLDAAMRKAQRQAKWNHPFKRGTMRAVNSVGEQNIRVLTKLRELHEILKTPEDKNLSDGTHDQPAAGGDS